MTNYKVTCDGQGQHPDRLLGVLIDDRKPFDAVATAQGFERLCGLSNQLLPDQDRSDGRSIDEMVRGEALVRSRVHYRGTRHRLTRDETLYYETSSEGSLEVRLTRRGREWKFMCKTCRATPLEQAELSAVAHGARRSRRARSIWKFSEDQLLSLIDNLRDQHAGGLEISAFRVLLSPDSH